MGIGELRFHGVRRRQDTPEAHLLQGPALRHGAGRGKMAAVRAWLSPSGLAAAAFVGAAMAAGSGWRGLLLLLVFFVCTLVGAAVPSVLVALGTSGPS